MDKVATDADARRLLDDLLELTGIPERVVDLVDKFDKQLRAGRSLSQGQRDLVGKLFDEYA